MCLSALKNLLCSSVLVVFSVNLHDSFFFVVGLVGVLTWGSGSQLVNDACFLALDVDGRGNTVMHGFILVPATGRTSSKGVCEGTVLSFTRNACSRGYKRGERGRKAPKSLLEEESVGVSAQWC